ncbi:MAG: hypothetical protein QRY74_05340 [Chlamydia sp.]
MNGVVSRNSITRTFRTEMPLWGAYTSQEESIWTKEGGKFRLKKTIYLRDQKSGLLLEEQLLGSDGERYGSTFYKYDSLNRCIEVSLSDGSKKSMVYDPVTGQIAIQISPQQTEEYTYDLNGQLLAIKTIFPDGSSLSKRIHTDISGRYITEIDERGREKGAKCDLLGRVVEEIHPKIFVDGQIVMPTTLYRYEGMRVIKTLPNRVEEQMLFSSSGKPFEIVYDSGARMLYRYDALGREIETRDILGIALITTYDLYGNILQRCESIGDRIDVVLQKQYDRSRLIEEKTRGTRTSFVYDSYRRASSTVQEDLVTGGKSTALFYYDTQHRVSSTECPEKGVKDLTLYDQFGRTIESSTYTLTNRLLTSKKSLYDSMGRLEKEGILVLHDGT